MKPYSIDHHKRLNPKKESTFGKKKAVIKNKPRKVNENPLNPNKPIRFKKDELDKRVKFIIDIEVCQVCDTIGQVLDYPHHVMQGANKDDRYMINICVKCHRLIHEIGYRAVKKWREECKVIAWDNHLKYKENIDE